MSYQISGISVPTAAEMKRQLPVQKIEEIELTYCERLELQSVIREIKDNACKGHVWIPKLISVNVSSKLRAYPFNYNVVLFPRSAKGPETIVSWRRA